MDLDGPGRDVQVGRRSPYPEEFRQDAVALHLALFGKRTYAAVAADLGIAAEPLRTWVRKDEVQAAPAGTCGGGDGRRSRTGPRRPRRTW
ncbi:MULTISPECIES: transposase [unclassified Streptomyces]|uniref:transposase n=1 Tax=unclassified Streptomyces TaxID=2593676 RepID=UPI00367EB786